MLHGETRTKYSVNGEKCIHCGGRISGHGEEMGVIYWCDDCGGNNPSSPPNVSLSYGH